MPQTIAVAILLTMRMRKPAIQLDAGFSLSNNSNRSPCKTCHTCNWARKCMCPFLCSYICSGILVLLSWRIPFLVNVGLKAYNL